MKHQSILRGIISWIFQLFFARGHARHSPFLAGLTAEEKRIYIRFYNEGWNKRKESETLGIRECQAHFDAEEKAERKTLDEKFSSAQTSLQDTEDRLKVDDETRKKRIAAELTTERDEAVLKNENELTTTELMLQRTTQELGFINGAIDTLRLENPYAPTTKTFWNTKKGGILVTGTIIVSETFVTAPALIEDGKLPIIAYPLSLIMSVGIGLSCHFFGDAYAAINRRRQTAWLIIGLALIAMIAYVRRHDESNVFYTIANLVIYVIGIMISIHMHKNKLLIDMIEKQKEYYSMKDSQEKTIQAQPAKIEKVKRTYSAMVDTMAEKEKRDLLNLKWSLTDDLSNFEKESERINAKYEERKERRIALIHQSYSAGYSARLVEDSRTWPGTTLAIIGLVLTLASCSPNDAKEIEVMITTDQSRSIYQTSQEKSETVYNYVLKNVLELEDAESFSSAVKIYFSSFGTSSLPRINTLEIAKANSYLFRNQKKRKEDVEAFKKDLRTKIDSLFSIQADQPWTNISRSLCYQLNFLKESKGGKDGKHFYCFTDLIESSAVAKFDIYRRTPSMIDSLYDPISKAMKLDCPLPDLGGIDVTVVYQPGMENDELVLASGRYFQKYVQQYNGHFKIISNL